MLRRRAFCGPRLPFGAGCEALSSPKLEDMHDPFLLRDMDRAAARLREAIARKEKILLYGDYDVDGTTSIVILKKALDLAGATSEFFVPHRMRDGYGMRPEVIDRAASEGVGLVISVDTGIRANAVVEHARGLGIDVIVTDHHLPDTEFPLPWRSSIPTAGTAPIPKRTFAAQA